MNMNMNMNMNMMMKMKMMLVLLYLINHLDASPVYFHGRSSLALEWPKGLEKPRENPLPNSRPSSDPIGPKSIPVHDPTVPRPPMYKMVPPPIYRPPPMEHLTTNPHDPYANPTPSDRTTRLRARSCKIACKRVIDLAVAQTGAPPDDSCWAEIGKAAVEQLCTDTCNQKKSEIQPILVTAGGGGAQGSLQARVRTPWNRSSNIRAITNGETLTTVR
ncbi:uncharacterized protein LOC112500980 [Cynara cardunculus var. scolymus]|uniref:Uncharacterized protein n=1 Tax=Cynara cardunculus var. scolymus TaxID=59895 RepID=A0A103Y2C3_CYNCS|nr:uncharacterized protein LOC112500980 [Cynara cardunculus var. scolymus]KVI01237.1 hypothetical protein Ccrd_020496 [Cynara cardunculus var. scolymus]